MPWCVAGRIFCNLKGLSAVQGDRVRFYIMSLGDEVRMKRPTASLSMLTAGMEKHSEHLNFVGQLQLCRPRMLFPPTLYLHPERDCGSPQTSNPSCPQS